MKVYSEISLRNFEPWSGAVDNFYNLTCEELDRVEYMLEDLYPDGIEETTINDMFWFEFDTICEWLGVRTQEQIEEEMQEKQNEIYQLLQDYQSELDNDMDDEEIKQYFIDNYKDDIDELKAVFEDLKEELKRWE